MPQAVNCPILTEKDWDQFKDIPSRICGVENVKLK